ncbi:hypothetical protein NDN08_003539 [Rhodosorus marinus]|uniref:UBL3-like ubiquitin domain-containing protein n=1 Tax=Rhodosorus marinus TaxID=101924 RepID=A0AAV8UWU5_9RHOD|nr:hypothetical protein NDN08_003539 [Rhodosorus marinus]
MSATAAEVGTTDPAAVESADDGSECFLRFLLVNGNDFRMEFPSRTSIRGVKNSIIKSKPQELVDLAEKTHSPALEKIDDIRILYLGKFLEDYKTLEECSFGTGSSNSTTVHVSLKPSSSVNEVQKERRKKKSGCCTLQ